MTTATQLPLGFEPGFRPGLSADAYHAHTEALSSSGARKLLATCPAQFRYDLDNPPEPKEHFDIGHAAHRLVLGDGPELAVVDADDWRTKAARAERDEIRDEGAVPLLRDTYEQVQAMAAAIRRHPLASALFDPEFGLPEQSLFWADPETGVQCRARFDWLPRNLGGRLLVADYKTATDASDKAFERSVLTYRYDLQADWYCNGLQHIQYADDVAFLFVVQQKNPPYLVNVCSLSQQWPYMAADLNRKARRIFAECTAAGEWPGYGPEPALVLPPEWLVTQHEREFSRDPSISGFEGPSHE